MRWREIQRTNFTSWETLCNFLQLDPSKREQVIKSPSFVLNLPRRLAEKIEKNSIEDPLFLQFVSLKVPKEKEFSKDPVLEGGFCKSTKYLQKYPGRALLLTTSACAMHCRYCFRQHFPYETDRKDFLEEIKLLADDPSIHEIILSGGDPLSLSNSTLQSLISNLEKIPHLTRLRIHTRFPLGIPERIDDELLSIFEQTKLSKWFVIHSNHPREFDPDIFSALKKIQKLGVPVLNQSVLLKGVNDSSATLYALCEKLLLNGIIPYYLHQLDKVQGAEDFEVSDEEGKRLIQALLKRLPGYGVPRFVRETPGELSKVII